METEGLLDIDNDLHMFVLRYVFEARINAHLQEFTEGWNNHPLSTEENMSPIQLWLWGLHGFSFSADQEHLSVCLKYMYSI